MEIMTQIDSSLNVIQGNQWHIVCVVGVPKPPKIKIPNYQTDYITDLLYSNYISHVISLWQRDLKVVKSLLAPTTLGFLIMTDTRINI